MPTKRYHTKSHHGCGQCKRRHVKCDETPPQCANCTRKGLECDYKSLKPAMDNMQLFTPESLASEPKSSLSVRSRSTSGLSSKRSSIPPEPSTSFSLEDLGLLHHFTLHTSLTLAQVDDEEYNFIWQHKVPQIAQKHPFLMHAILSSAAAHQATSFGERDAERHRAFEKARQHYSNAIILFRESVKEVDLEQADVFLPYCILICLLTVCLEQEKVSDDRDPIGEFGNLLDVVHSSIGLLTEVRTPISKSVVGSLLRHTWNNTPHAISPDVETSIAQLETLALTTESPDEYMFALIKLRRFYTLSDPTPKSWVFLLSWPIQLSTEFSAFFQQRPRDPFALCILAHWCVAAYNAPTKWFTGDWPQRMMLTIAQEVQGTYSDMIQWPLQATLYKNH